MVVPEILAPGGAHLNQLLLDWCGARLGCSFAAGSVAIGVARNNDLLAVAVFENYRTSNGKPLSIECSIAADSPRWITKGTVRAILSYPFLQLGVQRITALVHETNERSVKFLNGLGFVREGYIRDALENGAGVYITGMLRAEAAKWLGGIVNG